MDFQFAGIAVLAIAVAAGVSVGSLWMIGAIERRLRKGEGGISSACDNGVSFLFHESQLVDTTECAQMLISLSDRKTRDFDGIATLLAQRFPTLRAVHDGLGGQDQRSIYSVDHSEIATLRRNETRLRLTLSEVETQGDQVALDRPSLIAFERELDSLRGTTQHMPFLVWRQDSAGNINWVNRAYLDACRSFGDQGRTGLWPPCRLFEIDLDTALRDAKLKPQRHRLGGEAGKPTHWFQFHITPLDGDFLISGMNVDTVVEAEDSQRTFVQTLSKTFADLPIGLAVFTRDRRLALFNPALTDLTAIAPEKLIMRPTLFGFFDMLRELQMMPEPKNYNTWRDQIVDLEASASNGTYRETWHLPFGRTFRVTGRPQIDGAVALLFEDISDEIGMTRRYRTELEVGQSVLDSLPQGMAVFSANGVLTLTNSAYDALWDTDTREGLDTLYVADATRYWSERCAPSPLWGQVRDFVMSDYRREPMGGDLMLLDGRPLQCVIRPVSGGSTLVQFQVQTDVPLTLSAPPVQKPSRKVGAVT